VFTPQISTLYPAISLTSTNQFPKEMIHGLEEVYTK